MDHVTRSQVLLFTVDYAMSRQIMSWGVEPVALLGHSAGELVAATLAGVFDLPDAVELLWDRVHRLAEAPPGGMLAVAGRPEQIESYLDDGVVVGAVNSPSQLILAGPRGPLDRIAAALTEDGFTCRDVPAVRPRPSRRRRCPHPVPRRTGGRCTGSPRPWSREHGVPGRRRRPADHGRARDLRRGHGDLAAPAGARGGGDRTGPVRSGRGR